MQIKRPESSPILFLLVPEYINAEAARLSSLDPWDETAMMGYTSDGMKVSLCASVFWSAGLNEAGCWKERPLHLKPRNPNTEAADDIFRPGTSSLTLQAFTGSDCWGLGFRVGL